MRFKVLPPADGLERLGAVQAALPLVPDDEESCCARVMREAGVPSQDEAKEWITFCRALGLAEETDSGYRRLRVDPDGEPLAGRFRERVYGAEDVLALLESADGPLTVDEAFERFEVPDWERQRHADPETVWRERVGRILGWAAGFDLAEAVAGGYRR
jgi:hypothetical protein